MSGRTNRSASSTTTTFGPLPASRTSVNSSSVGSFAVISRTPGWLPRVRSGDSRGARMTRRVPEASSVHAQRRERAAGEGVAAAHALVLGQVLGTGVGQEVLAAGQFGCQ